MGKRQKHKKTSHTRELRGQPTTNHISINYTLQFHRKISLLRKLSTYVTIEIQKEFYQGYILYNY